MRSWVSVTFAIGTRQCKQFSCQSKAFAGTCISIRTADLKGGGLRYLPHVNSDNFVCVVAPMNRATNRA
jgi:hypothetical protein